MKSKTKFDEKKAKLILDHINRLRGQLGSVAEKVESDDYDCEALLLQLKAIQGSSRNLVHAFLEYDLARCMKEKEYVEIKEKLKLILK